MINRTIAARNIHGNGSLLQFPNHHIYLKLMIHGSPSVPLLTYAIDLDELGSVKVRQKEFRAMPLQLWIGGFNTGDISVSVSVFCF